MRFTRRLSSPCRRALLVATCLFVPIACAQSPSTAAPLAFDVVSIHPNHSAPTIVSTPIGNVEVHRNVNRILDDGYIAENTTIKAVISSAYNIKQDAISGGPDWIDSDRFDISARVSSSDGLAPPKLTKAQRNQMLQSLLADRFQLVIHNQTHDALIYELTVTKSGPKFHATTPGDTFVAGVKGLDGQTRIGDPMMTGPGQITGQAVTLASIIDMLSQTLQRPIVDKTGLTGKYDIALHWTPDNMAAAATSASSNANGPTLFTALQEQLGLKLDSTKGPVKTVVIDHIELPSEN
jgi:uncharacterized protein (TIGR03435 family)